MVEAVSWPAVSQHGGKMTAGGASPPILAVRPFMGERSHQWCGEMSLPSYYDRSRVAARRHSFPSDLAATAAVRDSADRGGGGRAAAQPPPRDVRLAVAAPRWTSFRGNSWQQELDAVRYLLDIDESKWEGGGRRPGSVVSCRTECISPESPLKALPKQGFSPTIHDRETKTRAESEVNRQHSLTAKTVRVREPPPPPPPRPAALINLKGQRVKPSLALAAAAAASGTYPTKGGAAAAAGVGGASVTARALEDFYRQLVTTGYERRESPPSQTLLINRASVDECYAHSAGAADSKGAFRILRSDGGQRTTVEKALERDYALLARREQDERSTPRISNASAQARILRPSNGSQTQGELFIRLSRDYNRAGKQPPPPPAIAWQRREASYPTMAAEPQPMLGARALTDVQEERRRDQFEQEQHQLAFPSIVG